MSGEVKTTVEGVSNGSQRRKKQNYSKDPDFLHLQLVWRRELWTMDLACSQVSLNTASSS